MKNKIQDLNDHLFSALERLNDEDLDIGRMEMEIDRATAISGLADSVVKVADLRLKAARMYAEHGEVIKPFLPEISSKTEAKVISQ